MFRGSNCILFKILVIHAIINWNFTLGEGRILCFNQFFLLLNLMVRIIWIYLTFFFFANFMLVNQTITKWQPKYQLVTSPKKKKNRLVLTFFLHIFHLTKYKAICEKPQPSDLEWICKLCSIISHKLRLNCQYFPSQIEDFTLKIFTYFNYMEK